MCVTDDPCMGISCNAPPAAVCVGDQAWQFELPGGCLDGECSYNTLVTDCAADGLRCVGGECIDPCEGVTCETPPPRCGPDNALIVAERPTCEGGVCSFDERVQPCPDGWYCDGAECVDPCESVVCDEQISWCVGDIRGYRALPGVCSGFGFCGYSILTEDCAARGGRCVAGQCVTGDPCAVVSCPATSGRTCDGNTAVVVDGAGVCFDGACDYSAVSVRTDCGSLACLDGACVEPLLPLAGQLVVTEIFARPAGGAPEWIELVSLAPARVNLGGVQVRNAVGASWTIPAGTLLDPLERLVLASGAVAGSSRTLVWSGIALGDTSDTLVLPRAGIELSRLAYDAATGWPVVSGVAMQSDPLALLLGPGERRLWCRADAAEAGVPAGTPSSANGACFACDDNADCPAGAAVCEGDVVLDYGDLLCLRGYCAAFEQIGRVDCSDVGAVCRDGACTAP